MPTLIDLSQDIYEAAELDGIGPFGKLFKIELPLIMTQIRINLIPLTIWTFTDYSLFLILLGPHGGPGRSSRNLFRDRSQWQEHFDQHDPISSRGLCRPGSGVHAHAPTGRNHTK